MKNELKIFLTALSFYTRVPVGNIKGWSERMLNKSTRYFPFIGILVGGVGALVFTVFNLYLPVSMAVILSMVSTILFTGAFHEDGFADFCDGFGGGYTPEKILLIMKDSRIGTYGSIGLISILGAKFITLMHTDAMRIPIILIAGHAFSRVFPVLLIYTSEYARLDASSKTKPVGKADSLFSLLFAVLIGSAPLIFFGWHEIIIVVALLMSTSFFFRNYITRKLGGYTGDVLGALQQLCEVGFYLAILACENCL
ncbi:adenosylcobinamide-GDP ribazoletransferase [Prolixibacteraceae bacterium Z1-6]|uniref:Adenosylcobinamide-GDP ribazoletransferase n=1 Tax=Draconibacterium aestuarii TaxID=2998507 RepID=A0A9X3J470_9BACT|nr:adenosylcobinamide-GDP ribazoletransferase [Prolixibacteraceae bacterium Z1-6]